MESTTASKSISPRHERFLLQVNALDLRFPVAEIARRTKATKGNVSEFLNKKREPSANFLEKFAHAFSKELASVDLEKAVAPTSAGVAVAAANRPPAFKGVPVYDVEFTAGFAASMKEARETAHPIAYLAIPEVIGCDAIVRARGESMCDFINPNDWVGIKQVFDFDVILWGNAYGVVTDELETFKYVRKGEKKGFITLRSHNHEQYEDMPLSIKKIDSLFLVKVVLPFSQIKILA